MSCFCMGEDTRQNIMALELKPKRPAGRFIRSCKIRQKVILYWWYVLLMQGEFNE